MDREEVRTRVPSCLNDTGAKREAEEEGARQATRDAADLRELLTCVHARRRGAGGRALWPRAKR
jgi:hypothetical protein